MNLATIQEALRGWVVAASSLPDGCVAWGHETIGRGMPQPYITMQLRSLRQIGHPEVTHAEIEGTPDAGAEIEVTSSTTLELIVALQAFADDPVGLLQSVRNAGSAPALRATLRDAGIGLADFRAVFEFGGVQGQGNGSRGAAELRCYVRDTATERLGYIETVEITDHVTDPEETFTVTLDD